MCPGRQGLHTSKGIAPNYLYCSWPLSLGHISEPKILCLGNEKDFILFPMQFQLFCNYIVLREGAWSIRDGRKDKELGRKKGN